VIAKIAISPLRFAWPRHWVINLIELISNPDGIKRQVLNRIDTQQSIHVRKRALSALFQMQGAQQAMHYQNKMLNIGKKITFNNARIIKK